MRKEKVLSTLEEIKVISDPFRFKILVLFNKESGSLTVKQMSVKLQEVPSKVHYHVKELVASKICPHTLPYFTIRSHRQPNKCKENKFHNKHFYSTYSHLNLNQTGHSSRASDLLPFFRPQSRPHRRN